VDDDADDEDNEDLQLNYSNLKEAALLLCRYFKNGNTLFNLYFDAIVMPQVIDKAKVIYILWQLAVHTSSPHFASSSFSPTCFLPALPTSL